MRRSFFGSQFVTHVTQPRGPADITSNKTMKAQKALILYYKPSICSFFKGISYTITIENYKPLNVCLKIL